MRNRIDWLLQEVDSLKQKIEQMIADEAIVEYITYEKRIEH